MPTAVSKKALESARELEEFTRGEFQEKAGYRHSRTADEVLRQMEDAGLVSHGEDERYSADTAAIAEALSRQPPSAPNIDEMETPEDVFYAIGRHLGMTEKKARTVAFYIANNYDMDDASQVWDGLKECPELQPTERKRWWRTWVNRQNLHVPLEVAEKAAQEAPSQSVATPAPQRPRGWVVDEETGDMRPAESGEEEATLSYTEARQWARDIRGKRHLEQRGKGKSYIAVGTKVVPVEGDDGMPFYQALQEADRQWDQELQARREEMERSQSQNQNFGVGDVSGLVTAIAGAFRDRGDGGTSQQLIDSRMREVETRFTSAMELERERHNHTTHQITEALKGIVEGQDRKTPLEQITDMARAMEAIDALRSGEPLDDATAWRQDRRAMLRMARENFPDFIDAAREVAQATRAQAQSLGDARRILGICPGCETAVRFSEDSRSVRCPHCGTSFGPDEARPIAAGRRPELKDQAAGGEEEKEKVGAGSDTGPSAAKED